MQTKTDEVNSVLTLGFNKDIDNSTYHGDREYVSSSALKMINKDPRGYYKTYVLNEEVMMGNSAALDFGSYVHALILEPHLVETDFAIWEGKARRGKAYEEFVKENEGKIIITQSQQYQGSLLLENFNNSNVILGNGENSKQVPLSSFYQGGQAEETLCVELEGVKVKVRFDYRKEFDTFGSINDIKTTSSLAHNRELVEKICDDFEYDLSAALYVDAVQKETGLPHDFYFTFICKKDGCSYMYKASEEMLERGREKYKRALKTLKESRETGQYFVNRIEELR